MDILWNPNGTVKFRYRREKGLEENNKKIYELQKFYFKFGIGSGIFYRAIEIIELLKPENIIIKEYNYYALIILFIELEISEKKGNICLKFELLICLIHKQKLRCLQYAK